MIEIQHAVFPRDGAAITALLREYAAALDVDLCFQDFEAELASLPGKYAAPDGALLMATIDGQLAGCVALRRIDMHTGEMKRLYVRPQARGRQLGRLLAERICDEARRAGYARLCLDTLPSMRTAQSLYRELGFLEIDAYVFNPVAGTIFMAKTL